MQDQIGPEKSTRDGPNLENEPFSVLDAFCKACGDLLQHFVNLRFFKHLANLLLAQESSI